MGESPAGRAGTKGGESAAAGDKGFVVTPASRISMKEGEVDAPPDLPDGGVSQLQRRILSQPRGTPDRGVLDARGEQGWEVAAEVGVAVGVGLVGAAASGSGRDGEGSGRGGRDGRVAILTTVRY